MAKLILHNLPKQEGLFSERPKHKQIPYVSAAISGIEHRQLSHLLSLADYTLQDLFIVSQGQYFRLFLVKKQPLGFCQMTRTPTSRINTLI